MRIYWSSIEVLYKEGAAEFGDLEGGFVCAFVQAQDAREALEKLAASTVTRNWEIAAVDYVSPYEEIPWDSEEDQAKYDGFGEEAGKTSEVVFDEVCSYEKDDR